MRKNLFYIALVSILLVTTQVVFLSSSKVSAALSGSQFKAGRIIDDAIFYNGDTMTADQIQKFLSAKVPACDTYGTQPSGRAGYKTRADWGRANGAPPPYKCLKSYKQNTPFMEGQSGLCSPLTAKSNRTAAQIINDVAGACGVSEKALIVLLQKEQGIVTDEWPWPKQYDKATGYYCPDDPSRPGWCHPDYAGFFKQVYYAALQFQRYKADPHNWNHIPGMNNNILYQENRPSCGTKKVYIENYATAGLYNYTPYTPNKAALDNLYGTGDACSAYGNRNFWRMHNDWFGPTLGNMLPGGATLQRESSTGRIYLVAEDKKYLVPSWEYMIAYRLTGITVQSVSTSQLANYTDKGTLTNLIRHSATGRIDLVDNSRRYWVSGSTICSNWGLDCFNSSAVQTLPDYLNSWLYDKGQLKPLARNTNGVVYELKNGNRSPIYSPTTMSNLGYDWQDVVSLQSINIAQPLGPLRITHPAILKFSPNPAIYYFDGTSYHHVPNMAVLNAWNFSSQIVSPAKSKYNTTPPTAAEDLTIWTQIGSDRYIVDGGKRIKLSASHQSLWPDASFQTFSGSTASKLPSSTLQPFIRTSPHMYLLDNGTKRHVPTMDDLRALGYNGKNHTTLSAYSSGKINDGVMALASGSLVRIAGDSRIYVVSGSKLHHIPGPSIFNDLGFSWSRVLSVDNEILNEYTIGADLTKKVRTSDGYSYFYDKKHFYISASYYASEFGLKTEEYLEVNSGVTRFIKKTPVTRFLRNSTNGAIYYGSGGALHYVTSMDSFRRYGGNSRNMLSVPSDFINQFAIGKPI